MRLNLKSEIANLKSRLRPGVILLEILLSLALFVLAAAVVGSVMTGSIAATADTRQEDKAVNMAQTVLAQLASGEAEIVNVAPSPYDPNQTDWTYEVQAEDLSGVPGLKRVTVTVRNATLPRPVTYRITQWMLAVTPGGTDQADDGYVAPEEMP